MYYEEQVPESSIEILGHSLPATDSVFVLPPKRMARTATRTLPFATILIVSVPAWP